MALLILFSIVPLAEFVKAPPLEGDHCRLRENKPKYITLEPLPNVTCTSTAPVKMTSCKGNCQSETVATYGKDYYKASDCSCCKPVVMQQMNVNLTCTDNVPRTDTFTDIIECRCETYKCEVVNSHKNEITTDAETGQVLANQKRKRRRRALSRLFALPP